MSIRLALLRSSTPCQSATLGRFLSSSCHCQQAAQFRNDKSWKENRHIMQRRCVHGRTVSAGGWLTAIKSETSAASRAYGQEADYHFLAGLQCSFCSILQGGSVFGTPVLRPAMAFWLTVQPQQMCGCVHDEEQASALPGDLNLPASVQFSSVRQD